MAKLVDWRSLSKLNLLLSPARVPAVSLWNSADSILTGLLEGLQCYSRWCSAPSPSAILASSLGIPGMEARAGLGYSEQNCGGLRSSHQAHGHSLCQLTTFPRPDTSGRAWTPPEVPLDPSGSPPGGSLPPLTEDP